MHISNTIIVLLMMLTPVIASSYEIAGPSRPGNKTGWCLDNETRIEYEKHYALQKILKKEQERKNNIEMIMQHTSTTPGSDLPVPKDRSN